jgi:hypothetical protein
LEGYLVGTPVLEGYFCDVVAGFIEGSHSGFDLFRLPFIGCQLDFESQIHHIYNIIQYINMEGKAAIPPTNEFVGFLAA